MSSTEGRKKFQPLGSNLSLQQRRDRGGEPPPEAKAAHALEHIATQLDAIVELLDELCRAPTVHREGV
jgi:hypothetical protein